MKVLYYKNDNGIVHTFYSDCSGVVKFALYKNLKALVDDMGTDNTYVSI